MTGFEPETWHQMLVPWISENQNLNFKPETVGMVELLEYQNKTWSFKIFCRYLKNPSYLNHFLVLGFPKTHEN